MHVYDVADEAAVHAVVPDNLPVRAGDPLEHTALLPAPGPGLAQLNPAVAVGKINHTDADQIFCVRRAIFEIDLHAEYVAAGGVELQLVIVTEPVMLGPGSDGAHGHQRILLI